MQTATQNSDIRFQMTCSNCNDPMLVKPEYGGGHIQCPGCEKLIPVPYPVAKSAPSTLTAISAQPVDKSWQWQRVHRPMAIPQPRAWR